MSPEERTVEAAIELLEGGALTTVTDFVREFENVTAIEDESAEVNIPKPCVKVEFDVNEEAFPQSGVFVGTLRLIVVAKSHDTTHTEYEAMKSEVYNFIYTDDLPDRLTDAADDFTCYGFAGSVSLSKTRQGSDWESTISIPIAVCAADVAAS